MHSSRASGATVATAERQLRPRRDDKFKYPFRPLEALHRNSYARRSVALLLVLGASVSISVHSPNKGDENLNCALGSTVSRQLRSWICGAAAVRVATVHPEPSPTQSLNASNMSLHQTHQPGFAPSPSGG